jgi:prepilin-type N-terminal cleavage/methylation domain-containing protein
MARTRYGNATTTVPARRRLRGKPGRRVSPSTITDGDGGAGGFTLVELLVVITIIVILVAMLVPALDEAVYQAELAVCAARQKTAVTGVLGYAIEAQRHYPVRQGARDELVEWAVNQIANRFYDDRPVIFSAARPQALLDPFSLPLNLETTVPDNAVYATYNLWFDWRFYRGGRIWVNDRSVGSPVADTEGMRRIGDRFTFGGIEFRLLLSDGDRLGGDWQDGFHPDREGKMHRWPAFQDAVNPWPGWNTHGAFATWTGWTTQNSGGLRRGVVDLHYARDEGSVTRLTRVKIGDDRVETVPASSLTPNATPGVAGIQIPRQ